MMEDTLQKRISDAIGGEEDQGELPEEIEGDEEALEYAQDLRVLEEKLTSWTHEEPPKEYWRAFAKRVSGQLGDAEVDEDLLAPPAPDEPGEVHSEAESDEDHDSDANGDDDDDDDDFGLGALAALGGRSSVPSFEDDQADLGSAKGDDSGLIDLAALTAPEKKEVVVEKKAASSKKSAALAPSKKERGESPAMPSTVAGAPLKEESGGKGVYYLVGFLIVALLVVGYIALRPDATTDTGTGDLAVAVAPTVATPQPSIPPSDEPPAVAEATEEPSEDSADNATEPEASPDEAEASDDDAPGVVRSLAKTGAAAGHHPAASSPVGAPQAEAKVAPAPAPAAPRGAPDPTKGTTTAKSGTGGDLDDLLARATGGGSSPAKAPAKQAPAAAAVESAVSPGGGGDSSGLPDQPSRSQVRRAMGSVSSQVMACGAMVSSTVRVNAALVVSNDGAIQTATVNGGSSEVNACVGRAIKRARFPRFSQPNFSVTYPFVLSPP
jgi:hypothetical protein